MEHVACTIGAVCILAENKDLLAAIASVVVAGTFILGLWQYRRTQVWKRNEFLASEMEKFFNDQDVIDVEGMLDYTGKSFAHGEGDDKITIFVYHSGEHIPPDEGREFFVNERFSPISRGRRPIRRRYHNKEQNRQLFRLHTTLCYIRAK